MTRYEALKILESVNGELAKPLVTDKNVQRAIAASLLVIAHTLIEKGEGPGLQ